MPTTDFAPNPADRLVKRERVLGILDRHGVDAVTLTSAPAVNWYLDGARTHVSLAAPPIVAVQIDREGERVLITTNEHARLVAEELPAGIEIGMRPWWEPVATRGITEGDISAELRAARARMLPAERERYARLCADAATVVTDATTGAVPELREMDLASAVAAGLTAAGMEPLVVLVGGAARAGYRHPLPTFAPLGRRAMVVVCARRWGLIANLTRWIRFDDGTPEERDADERILEVEADIFAATRGGAPLGRVLDEIAGAYPRHGFATGEQLNHHQGGLAGYDGRDPRAVPGAEDVIPDVAHVAWNPSAPGAKVEDTVVISGDEAVPLTVDERWPTTSVRGVSRPLVRRL